MDINKLLNKIKTIEKEKLLLLALAGILLIGASYFENRSDNEVGEEVTTVALTNETNFQSQMEQKVKELVEEIKGISDVTVLITLKSGSEKVLKEDSENSSSERQNGSDTEISNNIKKTTVIFSQDGDDSPYVIKEIYPEIEGIAITAKGVSESKYKEEIINMLSALFNVPMHKISVLETD